MSVAETFVINRSTLSEQIYDFLHAEILAGRYLPGQRLDLSELVTQLKVSKMPLKEAIGRLASEGLVEVQAQRGTFVSRIDPQELQETFEVRRALEMLAGELAVGRVNKADTEKLRQLIAEMEQSTSLADVNRHLNLNSDFHGLLIELAGNRKLAEMYHRLRTPIQVAGIHYRSEDWLKRVAQEQKEHRAIVRALEQKDAEAVSQAISNHIKRGSSSLLEDVIRSTKPKT